MLPGGPLEDIYWRYVKNWWPYRNDPNVIFLHYSDVRKDLKGSVAKIADFLEVDLSPSELDVVVDRCSLQHMKKVKYCSNVMMLGFPTENELMFEIQLFRADQVNKFHYYMPLNKDPVWNNNEHHTVRSGKMVNKGNVGKGQRYIVCYPSLFSLIFL